ncbi:hypothetical protein [Ekhidna sp. To15]|uniref:hypothetical protein n=1 Tax=Ekhidna sp. To15 TaxID=3395267 RepID=UPI003F524D29
MKLLSIILIWVVSPHISIGQYEVLEAKRVKNQQGDKVKKGDFLSKEDEIQIAAKGGLTLDVESAMHMKLAPGAYTIGVESARHNEWYNTHLELTKQLKQKGMIMCKFRYKTLVVPGSDRHYEVDRIELNQKGLVRINSDTAGLTISWVNPNYRYKGGYHLVIRDYYNNGFIDIIETDEDTITFYPGKYGHKHMYYNIIADDCRASLRYKIEVNTPNARINSATTFINDKN